MNSDPEVDIVLRLKAASHFITREELAESLSVSGDVITAGIRELSERGYRIDHIPGQGYRLVTAPARLDGSDLKTALRTQILGREILVFGRVGSTNDVALALARSGSAEGVVVVAEEQLKGRGRLGRSWHSPAGKGLWFSIILRPPFEADGSATISLAGAAGVLDALRGTFGIDAAVKWPNDVLVGNRKICGLLTEAEFTGTMVRFVVVGIGLNVLHTKEDFAPDLRPTATSIRLETGRAVSRTEVLAGVLEAIEAKYKSLCTDGFEPIRQELLNHSTLLGRMIRVSTTLAEIEGTVHNIDSRGALVIRKENGSLERIMAGDIRMIA